MYGDFGAVYDFFSNIVCQLWVFHGVAFQKYYEDNPTKSIPQKSINPSAKKLKKHTNPMGFILSSP